MEGRVDARETDRRAAFVRWLSGRKLAEFHARHAGGTVEVLFEQEEDGLWSGYTGNYLRVAVRFRDILENELRQVVLGQSCGDFMLGELVQDAAIEVSA
jgi:tRNA A37 methylthiotransferase MiaB